MVSEPESSSKSFSTSLQICVWCWHHIMDMAEKDESEGRCPACRLSYDKEKIVGMAAKCERFLFSAHCLSWREMDSKFV